MSDPKQNPYVGPRTFEEADREYFFGREREAEDLLSLVIAEPLVLFYAQSGAGKSSLLNARVIPGLRSEGFTVLPVGRVGGTLAGDEKIDNAFTYNLLLSLEEGHRAAATLAATTLPDYLREKRKELESAADAGDELALVLVIDQFEEIITSHLSRWEDRRGFFVQLRQAIREDPLLWVVLTLREDFVAALDPFARLMPDRMRARYFMKRMGPQAARAAIERPAANQGRPFAAGVAKTLVDNLRQVYVPNQQKKHLGEYVEPVQLQVVCYQLWNNLADRPLAEITQKELDELGNVDAALSQFYEEAICDVLDETGGSELEVRNWFERQLITEAETRGTVYQGATETAGLPNEIVKKLESHFLLRAEIRAGATWYELVHDRFVLPILQSNQAWRIRQSPLVQAAEAWDRSERSRDLLYEGRQLKYALATVNRETAEPLVKEFLSASEDAQSQRELDHARKQAEEERNRANVQARAARILRVLAIALFVMGAVAIGAAASAVNQRSIAEANEREARANAQEAEEARALAEERSREAQLQADLAQAAEAEARASAEEARQASALAEENEMKAQEALADAQDARAEAVQNQQQAEAAREQALANADEADRLRQVAVAQSLAALAPRIIDQSNDTELAVLLALESLRINEANQGGLQGLIDSSLRGILSRPNFNTTLDEHDSRVVSVAFSPSGQLMASADEGGVVRVWYLTEQSAPSFILTEGADTVRSLTFGPDGSQLAYIDGELALTVWKLTDSEPSSFTLADHTAAVEHFAFGPGELSMTTSTEDDVILQWDLSGPSPRISGQLQRANLGRVVGLSPDGETLVTVNANGTINLWDLTIQTSPLKLFLIGHTDPVNAIAFTPGGQTLASADEGGQIRIWDLTDPEPFPTRLFPLKAGVAKMVMSGDGKTLVTFSLDVADLGVRLWDLENPDDPPVELSGHGSTIEDIAINAEGTQIASASSDRTIRLWDLTPPRGLPSVATTFDRAVYSVAYDPSGEFVAAAGASQTVHLTRVGGASETIVLRGHEGAVNSVAFSPDGEVLASGSDDGSVRLWPMDTAVSGRVSQSLRTLTAHASGVRAVAFSPDGTLLASGSIDGTVRLWSIDELLEGPVDVSPVAVLDNRSDPVWAVAFSPDGQTIASGHASSALLIWEVDKALGGESVAPAERLVGHSSGVCSVVFSPDGETLASAGQDLDILLWSPDHYDEDPIPLTGHEDWIFSLAFSPDSQELASASWDQTIRLWDLSALSEADRTSDDFEPDEPTTLTGHTSVVRSVAYSPDGEVLVSASEDKTVQLWQVEASTFIELACQQVRRNLSWEEWERNLPNEEYRPTCPGLPAHPSFLESARELAENGDDSAAIQRYELALTFSPGLELNPLAEAAAGLVDGGVDRAEDGGILDALSYFTRARELYPDLMITAVQWYALCSAGAHSDNAPSVVEACENAAESAIVDNDTILIYQICALKQNPPLADAVSSACDRAEGLIGSISNGDTVTGTPASEEPLLWAFEGLEGQMLSVSITDGAVNALDASLILLGPDGVEMVAIDSFEATSSVFIEDFLLPLDGVYVIVFQSYRDEEGSFQLSLSVEQ